MSAGLCARTALIFGVAAVAWLARYLERPPKIGSPCPPVAGRPIWPEIRVTFGRQAISVSLVRAMTGPASSPRSTPSSA